MNFSGLAETQRVRILMELRGAAKFVEEMNASAVATARMAREEAMLAKSLRGANTASFVQRQGMYTLRRFTFYATLGIVGLAFAVGRLGLSYYNTTQTAMVGFTGLLHSARAARGELDILYALAAASPFQFTDIVNAARLIQPYTQSLAVTNRTVTDLANTLSAAGQLTGSAMQRAALQMSHMFTIGRLTGQTLLALSRDFVPMNLALQHYLHLSGEAVRARVAAGLIDAATAAKALHAYILADPGRANAALNQSTRTLVGAFSTLKDLLGMSAASAGGGIFETIRKQIRGIDKQLLAMTSRGRHITMMDFVGAVDRQFSPRTHILMNSFILLTSTIKTLAAEFYFLYIGITNFFRPLDYFGNLIGQNRFAMKLLGTVLGTWIFLMALAKTRVMLLAEAEAIATLASRSWGGSVLFVNGALRIMNLMIKGELLATLGEWAFATKQAGYAGAKFGERVFINNGIMAKFSRLLLTSLIPNIVRATVAMWGFVTANLALITVWASVIVLLVVLYLKWGAFHKAVNDLWRDIIYFSPIIALSLFDAFGPIGAAILAIILLIRYWKEFQRLSIAGGHVKTASPAENRQIKHKGFLWNFWHGLSNSFPHPGLAMGGNVTSAGNVMVGERGPEILSLPRAARVTPLDNSSLHGSIVVKVYPQAINIDGKKVGEAVATAVTDKEART